MLDSAIADNGLVQPPSNSRVNYHRFNPLYRPRFLNRVPPLPSRFGKLILRRCECRYFRCLEAISKPGLEPTTRLTRLTIHYEFQFPHPPPNFNRCVDYVRLKGCRITILPLKNKLNKLEKIIKEEGSKRSKIEG